MRNTTIKDTVFSKCIPFLHSIGIQTFFRKIEEECFLPGLLIENGNIIIDEEALLYPGDILHEAGHIAVTPAAERPMLNNAAIMASKSREAEEMMAIAWSYAACVHLELDPYIVFHDNGYHGGGSNIVENLREGRFFGTATLEWCNMSIEPKHNKSAIYAYPKMLKWMRD
jgi:hypothetical protein